jgi:hypothetical protein
MNIWNNPVAACPARTSNVASGQKLCFYLDEQLQLRVGLTSKLLDASKEIGGGVSNP